MRAYYPILLLLSLSCQPGPAPPDKRAEENSCPLPVDSNLVSVKDTVSPERVVAYAKTLIGTPYKFGCTAPETGFDCSGFIGYVFHHFNIEVPRSSVDFTNDGTEIALDNALPGDLILFTGTNSKIRTVGHIGLIVSHDSSGTRFIHSSSGKENAVIITQLDERYMARFVKVIRILK